MNKHQLHHIWTQFRAIKPWYFLAVALLSAFISVFALRANNEHMVKLRSAVYTADKNNTNVQGALDNLQAYVTAHMNTELSEGPNAVYPPIQLQYTYNRLVAAESNQVAQTNTGLYTTAENYCQQQDPTDFSGHNRVPCIIQYVQSHGVSLQPIPDALYKFDFVSPSWSPDLAGWSIVVAVLAAVLFVLTFVADRWFKHQLA